jgi:hypothetical protein
MILAWPSPAANRATIRKPIMIEEKRRYLGSWKEIAQYLGRGVRTVQRWEERLGLPVRRLDEKPRSAVMAIADELDLWVAHTTPGLLYLNGSHNSEHREPCSKKILVVEGSAHSANNCVASLLKRLGVSDVDVARDIPSAILRITDLHQDGRPEPDAIILDLGSFGEKAVEILQYVNAWFSLHLDESNLSQTDIIPERSRAG